MSFYKNISLISDIMEVVMLKRIDSNNMGKSNYGWLKGNFHFSFAEYFKPTNINFGVLRVLNDEVMKANSGFDIHPHNDMEIITYIVRGELTHGDSMGNIGSLERGQMQYMSAGTGVYHSEFNHSNEDLRILQIWIMPDKKGYKPNYGDYRFNWRDRTNNWLHMVSGTLKDVPINVHQDINVYATYLERDKEIYFNVNKGRQAYLVQIEGNSEINNVHLNEQDALEIVEENIKIKANENSHLIVIEMNKTEALYI